MFCIGDTHITNTGKSLCGKVFGPEWHFVDIDHWFNNRRNDGRLFACSDCLEIIAEQMKKEAETQNK